MSAICAPSPLDARRTTGLFSPVNSPKVEAARRFVQPRVVGHCKEIALAARKDLDRVRKEIEGYALLSEDVLLAACRFLSHSDRKRLYDFLLADLDLATHLHYLPPIETAALAA